MELRDGMRWLKTKLKSEITEIISPKFMKKQPHANG